MSSTLSTPTARNLLGPLTTVFTAPPFCSDIYQLLGPIDLATGAFALANHKACSSSSLIDTSACWPSVTSSFWATWTSAGDPFFNADFGGLGFFSPGFQCPSGYITACTTISLSIGALQPSISRTLNAQFPLESGETAFGCCPSWVSCKADILANINQRSFTCDMISGIQICATAATSTSYSYTPCTPALSTASFIESVPQLWSVISGGNTLTSTISTLLLIAPLIQLNQRASTIPSQTLSPTTSVMNSSPSTPSSNTTTGLSSGAKIALGVALPLGLMSIAFLFACVWFQRRQRRRRIAVVERAELDEDAKPSQKHPVEMPNHMRYEAPVRENAVEAFGDHALEASALRSPVELDGAEATKTPE